MVIIIIINNDNTNNSNDNNDNSNIIDHTGNDNDKNTMIVKTIITIMITIITKNIDFRTRKYSSAVNLQHAVTTHLEGSGTVCIEYVGVNVV